MTKIHPRPPKGGWAHGTYTCYCTACGCAFMGDKRAYQCVYCAYKEPAPKPKLDPWGRRQIFAWTGQSPSSSSLYAPFVQVFHRPEDDTYTVTIRSGVGEQHSVQADGSIMREFERTLREYIVNG